jgi:hypothetical protein
MTATALALALLLAVPGAPSIQPGLPDPGTPEPSAGPWVVCQAPDHDEACSLLHRATELVDENRMSDARRSVERAVELRREAGQYPGGELWLLANLHYQSGRVRHAARTLDVLAGEARDHGDIDRLALALTESIVLHARTGRTDAALARLDRLMPLLDSPYLPASRRTYVQERLIGVSTRGPRPSTTAVSWSSATSRKR